MQPDPAKLRALKNRLESKRHGLVSGEWLIHGNPKKQPRPPRSVSVEKMQQAVNKLLDAHYSRKMSKRRKGGVKEGNNAIVFFNERRKHVMKVFTHGSVGDYFDPTKRTFRKTLVSCLVQISGNTFSNIDSEIKKAKEFLQRIKSKNLDPKHFDPNPERQLADLERKRLDALKSQNIYLKDSSHNPSLTRQKMIPFVYSIRIPRIFSEKRLPNGLYVVSMEYVKGPNFSELLEGLEKSPQTKEGKLAKQFIEKNNLDREETYSKLVIINRALVEASTKHTQNAETPFIPRMDSIIVEGVDRHGNLKLVIVDNA
jgi:hypothetical protein